MEYSVDPVDGLADDDVPLSVGSLYEDSVCFKNALRSEAIKNNFGVKMVASDKKRVIAVCSYRGCPWRIRASLCANGKSFEVRRLQGIHSCPGVNRAGNRLATTQWVANEIQDLVKKQPDIPPKLINDNLESSYGLSLPYMKLWRSREQARDIIYGSVDENYKWVPSLTAELLRRNPGSHITYTYSNEDYSFRRMYVSFKVCIDGFLAGCRYLVGLDACHLKSKHLGVLLSANSLDGNNGLFTLAFAVVEGESRSSWEWFMENLAISFGFEIFPIAFISDMEKGLAEALCSVFPDAEHRVCLRHLWKNLKRYFHCQDGQQVRSLIWAAANALTTKECASKLEEICDVCPEVHTYLISLPYKWSKSQFNHEIKHDSNTNNLSESFNSWIAQVRSKPVVDLVDILRGMLMEQRATRKINSMSWRGELVPNVEDYIRDLTTRKDQFIVRQSSMYRAEIEGRRGRHEVDIEYRECSCNSWQLTGLPCIHAVVFIGMKEHPLWHSYVADHYHISRYRMAYDGPISTLPSKDQWEVPNEDFIIQAPNTTRPRGRPRKNRLRSFFEKGTKVHKCGRCGQTGHHRSTCKNPINQVVKNRSKLPVRRMVISETEEESGMD